MSDYLIQRKFQPLTPDTPLRAPIYVQTDGDFTPAEAMEFGLALIKAARDEGVRFMDPKS